MYACIRERVRKERPRSQGHTQEDELISTLFGQSDLLGSSLDEVFDVLLFFLFFSLLWEVNGVKRSTSPTPSNHSHREHVKLTLRSNIDEQRLNSCLLGSDFCSLAFPCSR